MKTPTRDAVPELISFWLRSIAYDDEVTLPAVDSDEVEYAEFALILLGLDYERPMVSPYACFITALELGVKIGSAIALDPLSNPTAAIRTAFAQAVEYIEDRTAAQADDDKMYWTNGRSRGLKVLDRDVRRGAKG